MSIKSLCFVCEWNEGRSAHLELSVRHKLPAGSGRIHLFSAGLSQGGGINRRHGQFLASLGVPPEEIASHRSTVFGAEHSAADLILVAEVQMKERLLHRWPTTAGKVMTIRGFAKGFTPLNEAMLAGEADLELMVGVGNPGEAGSYREIEDLATRIAKRLAQDGSGAGATFRASG